MGKKILIADSGSTKTEWALVDAEGAVLSSCATQGINPVHMSDDAVLAVLCGELSLPHSPQEVYFYGSGVTEALRPRMVALLQRAFPDAMVQAESDMLGAARALFGVAPGIACILGTGANSCLYDGGGILMNTPPLGYILGDEGSGAILGRCFLNGIFKGSLPASLREKYLAWSGLDYPAIINKVYREPLANRFLASICPFISERIKDGTNSPDNPVKWEEAKSLSEMVNVCFCQFYENNLSPYVARLKASGTGVPPLGFVGSVAYFFERPLRRVMEVQYGLRVVQVMRTPMRGLVDFHAR